MESLEDRIRRITREEIEIVDYDPRVVDTVRDGKRPPPLLSPRRPVAENRALWKYGGTRSPPKPIIDMLVETAGPTTSTWWSEDSPSIERHAFRVEREAAAR